VVAEIEGRIDISTSKGKKTIKVISERKESEEITSPKDYTLAVEKGDYVKPRQVIATATGKKALRSTIGGVVTIKRDTVTVTANELLYREYDVTSEVNILVRNGDMVTAGQALTEGHLDLEQSLRLRGAAATQEYIIEEAKEIYVSQGQEINDKHVELIVARMFSKDRVIDEGDSELVPGQLIDIHHLGDIKNELKAKGKKRLPVTEPMVLGITRVSLKTDSFLSAASFQETTNVLIEAATKGAVDRLQGLKENVIIGRPIPAGTCFDVRSVKKKQ